MAPSMEMTSAVSTRIRSNRTIERGLIESTMLWKGWKATGS